MYLIILFELKCRIIAKYWYDVGIADKKVFFSEGMEKLLEIKVYLEDIMRTSF